MKNIAGNRFVTGGASGLGLAMVQSFTHGYESRHC